MHEDVVLRSPAPRPPPRRAKYGEWHFIGIARQSTIVMRTRHQGRATGRSRPAAARRLSGKPTFNGKAADIQRDRLTTANAQSAARLRRANPARTSPASRLRRRCLPHPPMGRSRLRAAATCSRSPADDAAHRHRRARSTPLALMLTAARDGSCRQTRRLSRRRRSIAVVANGHSMHCFLHAAFRRIAASSCHLTKGNAALQNIA